MNLCFTSFVLLKLWIINNSLITPTAPKYVSGHVLLRQVAYLEVHFGRSFFLDLILIIQIYRHHRSVRPGKFIIRSHSVWGSGPKCCSSNGFVWDFRNWRSTCTCSMLYTKRIFLIRFHETKERTSLLFTILTHKPFF